MAHILGTIVGLIFVIFVIFVLVVAGYRIINYNFDKPLFKTEITITMKTSDETKDDSSTEDTYQ